MLDMLRDRARKAGLESRIEYHLSSPDSIGLDAQVDFALAFYIIHEVPDPAIFLCEVRNLLKPDGRLLMVEPKMHVSESHFSKTVEIAGQCGLKIICEPRILLSRSVLLGVE
jgi:ubiquinone/menaquinone biosynthesis C-methylase UbiE